MVVQVAVPDKGAGMEVPWADLLMRDVRLRGTYIGSKGEAEEMLKLVVRAGIEVKREVVQGLEKVVCRK